MNNEYRNEVAAIAHRYFAAANLDLHDRYGLRGIYASAVCSILSDAQEEMALSACGKPDRANALINAAKHLMFDVIDESRLTGVGTGERRKAGSTHGGPGDI
jgi:hypothetical protein